MVTEYEAEIIGEITLHENERLVLMLPPKFSIEENLPPEGLTLDGEIAYTKARMKSPRKRKKNYKMMKG